MGRQRIPTGTFGHSSALHARFLLKKLCHRFEWGVATLHFDTLGDKIKHVVQILFGVSVI